MHLLTSAYFTSAACVAVWFLTTRGSLQRVFATMTVNAGPQLRFDTDLCGFNCNEASKSKEDSTNRSIQSDYSSSWRLEQGRRTRLSNSLGDANDAGEHHPQASIVEPKRSANRLHAPSTISSSLSEQRVRESRLAIARACLYSR